VTRQVSFLPDLFQPGPFSCIALGHPPSSQTDCRGSSLASSCSIATFLSLWKMIWRSIYMARGSLCDPLIPWIHSPQLGNLLLHKPVQMIITDEVTGATVLFVIVRRGLCLLIWRTLYSNSKMLSPAASLTLPRTASARDGSTTASERARHQRATSRGKACQYPSRCFIAWRNSA
jgi:hypothetical protein